MMAACVTATEKLFGDTLNLTRVNRADMGAYLCIASNGVPPSVSKRIILDVECKYGTISFDDNDDNGTVLIKRQRRRIAITRYGIDIIYYYRERFAQVRERYRVSRGRTVTFIVGQSY